MSERIGECEQSEQSGASKRLSGASERTNGRASGPVLQSVFLAVFVHSGSRHSPSCFSAAKCRGNDDSFMLDSLYVSQEFPVGDTSSFMRPDTYLVGRS